VHRRQITFDWVDRASPAGSDHAGDPGGAGPVVGQLPGREGAFAVEACGLAVRGPRRWSWRSAEAGLAHRCPRQPPRRGRGRRAALAGGLPIPAGGTSFDTGTGRGGPTISPTAEPKRSIPCER
jgi:hypothetical protein